LGDPARAGLDARIRTWMEEAAWKEDDARFDALALELFAFQFERCAPYARFCQGRGRTPGSVRSWRQIPPVPTGAFKELPLRSFPARRTLHTFRTSGTSTEKRGELHLDSLTLYETSLLSSLDHFLFPDLARADGRMRIRILAPSPSELPDSSLSHMFGCLLRARGDRSSGFDFEGGRLRTEELLGILEDAIARELPVAIFGTAFAFVHLLDTLAASETQLRLPSGSRVMETGGFKGRSREVPRDELHRRIETHLGVPPGRIVNQYGMTELGSQFYDSVLRHPDQARRKLGPPWARVRIVDAEGDDVPSATAGRIAVVDLANTGSVLAIQTADLGRADAAGFEVIGREPGAEARGCSLAADAMLGKPAS
jgi:hypothetical protein